MKTAKKMTLKERAKRISELDVEQSRICEERDRLYYEGLTNDEHNKLWDMVMSDGKSHWS